MKPKTTIANDFIAGRVGDKRVMVTRERFVAELGDGDDIDVPIEKLGTGTDDLWKNYVTGLLWIIGVRIGGISEILVKEAALEAFNYEHPMEWFCEQLGIKLKSQKNN